MIVYVLIHYGGYMEWEILGLFESEKAAKDRIKDSNLSAWSCEISSYKVQKEK